MKKYFSVDMMLKYSFKIFVLCFIFSLIYGAGMGIAGLYLKDLNRAEKIISAYSLFDKTLIIFLSGFIIIWFGLIIKYLFIVFILDKTDE